MSLKKNEEFKRYEFPIKKNREGQDNSVTPDSGIFSGMLKRTARETGDFIPDKFDHLED